MTRLLTNLYLWLTGWEIEGDPPAARKFVLLAAPHTSNWDLPFMLALAVRYGVRLHWMGKHTLFRPPMGWAMSLLGGVPIRRHVSENRVQSMARVFTEPDEFCLVVPPEGTRGYVPHWKSGFYHIAQTAGVPVVLGFLDYSRKRGGFGPELVLTGDISHDMEQIREFYADKVGRYPELTGEIRLKEEM